VDAVLVKAPGPALPAARKALEALPGSARVHDQAALREQLEQALGLSWAMVGAMLLLSVVLASAILYNTATLAVAERERELATLLALGLPLRSVAAAVTAENAALAALGLAMGVPLAALATRAALASFDTGLFSLPYVFSAPTCAVAALGVAAVLLLAELPGLRQVARLNLATAVRSREG
jgi:putative ABC transport system permease protein